MKTYLLIIFAALPALAGHPDPGRLADAIYRAEGGAKARSPYGVLSVKVKDQADARRVVLISIQNNWKRWEKAGRPGEFIDHMADRWCPASSDPVGNRNWKSNVTKIYNQNN